MDGLLHVALVNAAAAALLAAVAATVARLVRQPAVVHLLWLLVLAKLLTPPIVELGLLPAPAPRPPAASVTPAVASAENAALRPPRGTPTRTPTETLGAARPRLAVEATVDWRRLGLRIWALGAAALALLALWRIRRFRRWAAEARPADANLRRRAAELGARLGLRHPPEVRLTTRPLPPLVWSFLGAPRILLPRALWRRLAAAERDAVLAHELAHVRRGDHRVRLLELVAGVLFWWHPAVWWARRGLRRAEERCCDRRVLAVLPGAGRAYAGALLKTLELASRQPPLPALASGIENYQSIEERLTMILKNRAEPALPLYQRLPLLALALFALAVFPTWSHLAAGDDSEPFETEPQIEELEIEEMEQALEAEAEAEAIETRHLEAAVEAQRQELATQVREIEQQAAELEARGHAEEATLLRHQATLIERRADLDRKRLQLHREHRERQRPLERELRRQERGMEQKRREMEARLHEHQARIETELGARQAELEKQHRALELEHVEHRVEAELARLRLELPLRLQELRAHLEAAGRSGELSDRLARIQKELEAVLSKD